MPQVTVPFDKEGPRSTAVYSDTEADPAGDHLSVIVGSAVPLRRQTEIINAISFLQSGLRDRNILDGGFAGASCVSSVNINAITATNRRTSGTLAGNTATTTDVSIGIGVVANTGYTTMVETGFEVLKKVLLENIKDQDATASARILAVGNNFTFNGRFAGGQSIEVVIQLTDPDGDVEEDVFNLTLPPAPGGFHLGPVAAAVVCARIDALTHIRCEQVDNVLSITPSAPSNVLTVSIRLGA